MLQSMWNYIKKHPGKYIFGGMTAVLTSILYIFPNYIIQLFIDDIVTSRLTQDVLVRYLFFLFILMILIYAGDVTWLRVLFGESYQFQKELRQTGFKSLLGFRASFYEAFRSGDLMTRMTSDIDTIGMLLGYGLMIILGDGALLLSFLAVMIFTISWQVTLVSLIPLLIFGFIIYFLSKEVDKRYDAIRDSVAELSNEVLEVVDGVRVMRAYGRKDLEQKRFQEKTQKVVDKANHLAIVNGLFGQIAKAFGGLSIAIGLMYCSYLVNLGQLSVGKLVSFQLYLAMLNGTIWGMTEIAVIYQQGKVSFEKLNNLIKANDLMEADGHLSLDSIESIEFQDYSFKYKEDDKETIKNLNFTLHQGETLGIVGKTGSGKTTIIRQLLRQYPISGSGTININGRDIHEYQRENLEAMIGYVPQEHILFSQTVKYNILFGNSEANEEEQLPKAIENAAFTKDLDRMSEGLKTLIGEKGVSISGGQKQRVSIARALIKEPELLILDDSLSAVDAKTERAIITNIQSIRGDKTNIIVTHRLSAVNQADMIIVVDDGRIVESGSPKELLANEGWYYEQFNKQKSEGGAENENIH